MLRMENKCCLNASDYVWLRILPDDFYEDGIDAVWCKLNDKQSKPIAIDNKVVYYRKGMFGKLTGKVIDIFSMNGSFNEARIYYADPYEKTK